jgi:hypothetical protein
LIIDSSANFPLILNHLDLMGIYKLIYV